MQHNTISAHLAILARAGQLMSERRSRAIVYRADLGTLREITLDLITDCWQGRSGLCAPLVSDLAPCSPAEAMDVVIHRNSNCRRSPSMPA